MEQKIASFQNKGMTRDLSISKVNNEFAYENFNVRIIARDHDTLLSVTNERGNREIKLKGQPFIKSTVYTINYYSDGDLEVDSKIENYTHSLTFLWKLKSGETGSMTYTYSLGKWRFKDGNSLINPISEVEYLKADFGYILENYTYHPINIIYHDSNDDDFLYESKDFPTETPITLKGTLIGHSVLNNYMVLFTHEEDTKIDHIYRIEYSDEENWRSLSLFDGNLGFDSKHPIETLPFFESENIQKVYWVDGKNQPRFINIKGNIQKENNNQFDFITTFTNTLQVDIEKIYIGTTNFLSGTVQYYFTYSNKFGQETNIVYKSPLLYLTDSSNSVAADKNSSCAFKIEIHNPDLSFDNINIYSVVRTSQGSFEIKKVVSLNVKEEHLNYTDTGSSGYIIAPETLLYIGGREIVASTLSQKDNTLFLGNLKTVNLGVNNSLKTKIESTFVAENNPAFYSKIVAFSKECEDASINYYPATGYYPYELQLNQNSFKVLTYKGGEKYRFALSFITNTGQRSPAYWIGDVENTLYPEIKDLKINKAVAICTIPNDIIKTAKNLGYTGVVLQRAMASEQDRVILAQGVVAPTLFNLKQRSNNSPFALSSWFFRPKRSSVITNEHFKSLPISDSFFSEVQNSRVSKDTDVVIPPYYDANNKSNKYKTRLQYTLYLHYKYSFGGLGAAIKAAQLWADVILIYNDGSSEKLNHQFKTDWYNTWGYGGGNGMVKQVNKAINEFKLLFQQSYSDSYLPSEDKWNEIRNYAKNNFTSIMNSEVVSFGEFGPYRISGLSDDTGFIYSQRAGNAFYVDESLFTFHSPDINKDTSKSSFTSELKFRIIGGAKLSGSTVSCKIDLDNENKTDYFKAPFSLDYENITKYPDIFPSFPWIESVGTYKADGNFIEGTTGYMIYPWQKTGYLWKKDDTTSYFKLKSKTLATLRYSYYTIYNKTGNKAWMPKEGIEDVVICSGNSPEQVLVNYESKPRLYYGGYDIIMSSTSEEQYPLYNTGSVSFEAGYETFYDMATGQLEDQKLYKYEDSTEPINISVQSAKHIVISLKQSGITKNILPTVGEPIIIKGDTLALPWEKVKSIPDIEGVVIENPESSSPVFSRRQNSTSNKSILVLEQDKFKKSYSDTEEFSKNTDTDIKIIFQENNQYYLQNVDKVYYKLSQLDFTVSIVYNQEENYSEVITEVSSTKENVRITLYKESTLKAWEVVGTGNTIKIEAPDENSNYRVGVKNLSDINEEANSDELFTPVFAINQTKEVTSYNAEPSDIVFITGGIRQGDFNVTTSFNIVYTLSNSTLNRKNIYGLNVHQDFIDDEDNPEFEDTSVILIGELFRPITLETDSRYGGTSEDAIKNNTFIDAGAPVYFSQFDTDADIIVTGPEGDSYFQRYDFLKTLPKGENKENNVIEILSCMIESHSNIEGRYDNQRGITDNTLINPGSFNSINNSYTQEDSYITNTVLDDKFSLSTFSTQLTWTKTKSLTEETDSWTNITLASILDMDGDKGPLRAIRRFKNSLIAFQDKGIAEILFNSRTQIGTEQGVPIEIANSGKVDGKRYITDKAGCINKWSIVETKNGIYFIDNINSSLSLFTGTVKSLSDEKGFKDWIGRNNSTDLWNPVDFNNFVAYWDRVNDDVYFLRGNEEEQQNVLCYNEMLGQFTSFFSYGKVPMMVNVQDKFVAFKEDNKGVNKLWIQGEGEFNNLFGNLQDYHMLYRITPNPYGDKTFSCLEYRADMFDMSDPDYNPYMPGEGKLTGDTFDTLEVWNEYQGNKISVGDSTSPLYSFNVRDKYPNVRRKFRIWRMDIPRDKKGPDNPYGLNRIRNPWIYLKLSKTPTLPNERMEFHDLAVRYFE